jgi:hypothetical protein
MHGGLFCCFDRMIGDRIIFWIGEEHQATNQEHKHKSSAVDKSEPQTYTTQDHKKLLREMILS